MHNSGKGTGSGKNNPMFGKTGFWLNKNLSDETKRKMSEAARNRHIYGKKNPMYEKKHSEETRTKMSEAQRKRFVSEETRRKMSESMKTSAKYKKFVERITGKKRPTYSYKKSSKKVDMFDINGKFIRTFDSAKDACITMNVRIDSVYGCCIGRYKKGGGYIWKYNKE